MLDFPHRRIDIFQSTPPVWAETHCYVVRGSDHADFNPLRPCGRRRLLAFVGVGGEQISIHSARVGGDILGYRSYWSFAAFQSTPPVWAETRRLLRLLVLFFYFNPLRPCGRRQYTILHKRQEIGFQSTPPVWAETVGQGERTFLRRISIHSARVGGDCADCLLDQETSISIHSARVGGDVWLVEGRGEMFISIHSARVGGDARLCYCLIPITFISIHSARVGGDALELIQRRLLADFNPLRPCGRRPRRYAEVQRRQLFQSTPPVWAETVR